MLETCCRRYRYPSRRETCFFRNTLHMVQKQLASVSESSLGSRHPIAAGLLQSLETRFKDVFDCMTTLGEASAIAAMSLPQFRLIWFTRTPTASQDHLRCASSNSFAIEWYWRLLRFNSNSQLVATTTSEGRRRSSSRHLEYV